MGLPWFGQVSLQTDLVISYNEQNFQNNENGHHFAIYKKTLNDFALLQLSKCTQTQYTTKDPESRSAPL